MNPKILFWVPAVLRLCFVLVAMVLAAYFYDRSTGLFVGFVCMSLLVLLQLQYLYRLNEWLESPDSFRLPDGWGAWSNVFSRLYHMRRADERNQLELEEWLARFRQAMHLLPDGVVILDNVLFLEWCNPTAERHLGLSNEHDKGMRITNLVLNPDLIDYIILGRYELPLTLRVRERSLIVQIIPFEHRRQIVVTHDATESSRVETMRRDFIANASHELRTPLTVINGFLEIACTQEDIDEQARKAHLQLMREQGLRMQNLIEDMLALSRLESASENPFRPEPVDVGKLLEQVFQDAKSISRGQHVLSLHVDGPNIMGNAEELRSAFSNLVVNAIRYTPAGGVIDIGWQQTPAGPRFLVRDNGIGIDSEHISRLTERFFRVDKSRSREAQGTGLGLAIVKHVTLRHGATLGIDSTPGEGSRFSLLFPRTAVDCRWIGRGLENA